MMGKILRAIVYAVVGGVVLGALVFFGGFGLAKILGHDAQVALGMLVPMVATPAAILIGDVAGAIKGWRAG